VNILVACEFSGIVRDAFIRRGHCAISCDLLPTEVPGPHYQGDIRTLLWLPWDMLLTFPPCTHLASSGARWWKEKENAQAEALEFVRMLLGAPIPKICLENPVGIISTRVRKPDQYIQPWMFGHGETKKTGLWLKGLPLLQPTDVVSGREPRVHHCRPGPDRWKERSRFLTGIAQAMAQQWG